MCAALCMFPHALIRVYSSRHDVLHGRESGSSPGCSTGSLKESLWRHCREFVSLGCVVFDGSRWKVKLILIYAVSGSHGILTTTEGLRIAFLSGVFNACAFNDATDDKQSKETDQKLVGFTEKDMASLLSQGRGLGGVDFLLTTEWPTDITQFSETAKSLSKLAEVSTFSADPITNLSLNLQPRYHFASLGNTFYEREPFSLSQLYPSRFIGLSNFETREKTRKRGGSMH